MKVTPSYFRFPSEMSARRFVIYETTDARQDTLEVFQPIGVLPELPLGEGGCDLLRQYTRAALDHIDVALSSERGRHGEDAGLVHDVGVYLCDWIVHNVSEARWELRPTGEACVTIARDGNVEIDPIVAVREGFTLRTPFAHRFVDAAMQALRSELTA